MESRRKVSIIPLFVFALYVAATYQQTLTVINLTATVCSPRHKTSPAYSSVLLRTGRNLNWITSHTDKTDAVVQRWHLCNNCT